MANLPVTVCSNPYATDLPTPAPAPANAASVCQLRRLHQGLRQVIAALDIKNEADANRHLADLY